MKKKLLTFLFFTLSVLVMGQTYSKDLEKKAKSGDVIAQRDLGISYLYGNGTKVNYNKAYEWLIKAGEEPNHDGIAQYHLGVMCENGYYREVKAFEGRPYAELDICIKIGGDGNPSGRNYHSIYIQAYKNGSKEAAKRLYEYYKSNDNKKEALRWLKISAENGDVNSQFEYGKLLSEGKQQPPFQSDNLSNLLNSNISEKYSIKEYRVNSSLAEAKSWFEKAAVQGHEEAKIYLQRVSQELDALVLKANQERIASQKAAEEMNTRLKQYRNIKLEKPNSILSVFPIDLLSQIDSLTIVGFMYETDLKILEECKQLRYLDLSKTYITYSPAKVKEMETNAQYLKSLFQFMGVAADAKYNDYQMSTLDYAYVKGFSKLMADGVVSKADDGCLIPMRSMCNMAKLETLILPTRAYKIEAHSFMNCKALKTVKLPPYLKVIGTGGFYGCRNLRNIDFPKTLTTIGSGHIEGVLEGEGSFMSSGIKKFDFSKCTFTGNYGKNMWYFKLFECQPEEIRLPSGVERVHIYARLNKTSMTVYVPASVKMIDIEANVPSTVHFASPIPPKYDTYKFESNSTFYVPKGSITAYYSTFGNTYKYIEE